MTDHGGDADKGRDTMGGKRRNEAKSVFDAAAMVLALDQGARRGLRLAWDHVWGPTGSVILHVLVLWALIHWVTFERREMPSDIEVMIMDHEPLVLDNFDPLLDDMPDVDFDSAPMEVDISLETAPDVEPPRPDSTMRSEITALNIRTDVQSSLIMRDLFASRTIEGRDAMRRRHGGRHGEAADVSAYRALQWLRDRQQDDGSWDAVHQDADGTWRPGRLDEDGAWTRSGTHAGAKTAWTGLALLTFLAHNETPNSGEFGSSVERGLRFLIHQAQREDGTFRYTEGGQRGGVYSHGIAAYALSEAYALTRIPTVKAAMEKAMRVIIDGMRPDGGFDYAFEQSSGHRDRCTSVAAWMAQALKAAYISGADIEGLEEAMIRVMEGFKLNFDESSGRFLYASGGAYGRSVSVGQTAPGALSLQLLGASESSEVRQAVRTMSDWRPSWTHPPRWTETLYLWYYATQVYFHAGGGVWNRWNDAFSAMLIQNQNRDGSWIWPHGRAEAYGPVYATTFSALSLMVYYRYLPTYQEIAVEPTPSQKSDDDVQIEIL